MIDCSSELNNFYNEKVRLRNLWDTLGKYKNINLDRLKSGLLKNNNDFSYSDTMDQGSYSMKTVVQHEDNDYDIDIGVIFDIEKINDMTPKNLKNIVCEAMQDNRFNKQPEVLKNCIRVYYNEGHHIDMAVYRKNGDKQELASLTWEESNPEEITKWFNEIVIEKSPDTTNGRQLGRIVRFLKFWAISRKTWDMPSGLILTILAVECYSPAKDRDDESFYKTMKNIINRLEHNRSVLNPVNSQEITNSNKHREKVDNLYYQLEKLYNSELLKIEHTNDKKLALLAWKNFFNNDFFDNAITNLSSAISISNPSKPWRV